jgi:hypothetical protein
MSLGGNFIMAALADQIPIVEKYTKTVIMMGPGIFLSNHDSGFMRFCV